MLLPPFSDSSVKQGSKMGLGSVLPPIISRCGGSAADDEARADMMSRKIKAPRGFAHAADSDEVVLLEARKRIEFTGNPSLSEYSQDFSELTAVLPSVRCQHCSSLMMVMITSC